MSDVDVGVIDVGTCMDTGRLALVDRNYDLFIKSLLDVALYSVKQCTDEYVVEDGEKGEDVVVIIKKAETIVNNWLKELDGHIKSICGDDVVDNLIKSGYGEKAVQLSYMTAMLMAYGLE